jgi:hypothetical protein
MPPITVARNSGQGAAPGWGKCPTPLPVWPGPARFAKFDYTPRSEEATPGWGEFPTPLSHVGLNRRRTPNSGLILRAASQRNVRRLITITVAPHLPGWGRLLSTPFAARFSTRFLKFFGTPGPSGWDPSVANIDRCA